MTSLPTRGIALANRLTVNWKLSWKSSKFVKIPSRKPQLPTTDLLDDCVSCLQTQSRLCREGCSVCWHPWWARMCVVSQVNHQLHSAEVSSGMHLKPLSSLWLGAEPDFQSFTYWLKWSCSVMSRWWIGCCPRLGWRVEEKGRERCFPSGSIWTSRVNAAVFIWWSAQLKTEQAQSIRSVWCYYFFTVTSSCFSKSVPPFIIYSLCGLSLWLSSRYFCFIFFLLSIEFRDVQSIPLNSFHSLIIVTSS